MPRLRKPAPKAAAKAPARLMAWTAFWVFLLDQATKWVVVHWMDLIRLQAIELLPPVVNLRMAWNRGVNFGLLAGLDMRWVLVGVAVAISALVAVWVHRERLGARAHLSAGLLIGGALGNVVDRVLYGAVADFLNLSWWGWDNPYSFNVADISIFLGALGLVLFAGGGKGRASRPKAARTG